MEALNQETFSSRGNGSLSSPLKKPSIPSTHQVRLPGEIQL
jgi:hypothetical protein